MSAWPMVRLGEVCEVVMGQAPKGIYVNEDSIGTPLIAGAGDFSKTSLNISKWTSKPTKISKKSDLILSIRATIGTYRIADQEYCLGRGVAALRAKGGLNQEFLAFAIDFRKQNLLSKARGATFLQVSKKDIQDLTIPLPPLGEQKRIAEMLEQVTLAINTVQHNIENTLSFKKTSQDGIINANSANSTELSQIASIQSGITKGRKTKEDTPLKPVPYMAVSNVKAGRLDLSTVKKIDASEAEIDRYLLKTGDILLTEGGDPDKLGRGSIWRNEIQEAIHQNHIFRVRINPTSNFTSEALMAILESKESKYYFLRSAKQTTGISSINKTQLSATPIPVLDQTQVNEITRLWHDSEQIIALYRQKLALLQELQCSLSARAFAGLL